VTQPTTLGQETFADVRAAPGLAPVDLLLKKCRLVNVCSQEIHFADIAVRGSKIVAIRERFDGPAAKTLECTGSYAVPGFVQLETNFNSGAPSCVSSWIVASGTSATPDASNRLRHSRHIHAPNRPLHLAGFRVCSTLIDAVAALRSGFTVFLASPPNAGPTEILVSMRAKGIDTSRICLCLPHDDVSPLLRVAMANSFTAAEIFQMLSLNPARHFALDHEIGSIAPARQADILLTTSLDPFEPATIVFGGQVVFHEGRACV
jgi:adenine deaminase